MFELWSLGILRSFFKLFVDMNFLNLIKLNYFALINNMKKPEAEYFPVGEGIPVEPLVQGDNASANALVDAMRYADFTPEQMQAFLRMQEQQANSNSGGDTTLDARLIQPQP